MRKIYKLSCLFICLTFISCDEIFEEDISTGTILIIYPTDGTDILTNVVGFQWVGIEGADTYRIQIISEDHSFVIDSLVTRNSFDLAMDSGDYTWRVRGENIAYNSIYNFPISFRIEISEDLSNLSVLLNTPSDNIYINTNNITYSWMPLENASSYNLELIKSLGGNTIIAQETDITDTSITLQSALYNDGAEYIWKVSATNATSETSFSQRSLLIDRVNPNQPVLNSPIDEGSGVNPIFFYWDVGIDIGNVQSVISSTLEISTDSSFTNIIYSYDNASSPVEHEFGSIGDYYWRVKSYDAAGNESQFSDIRKITVM